MAKRKSILDLAHKVVLPKAAMRQLENGRWQVAVLFPKAIESLVFDRPTKLGAENELIHQCRKMGYQGWDKWDTLQEIWDTDRKPFYEEWQAMTCLDCGGIGSCPFCSSTGKVYERRAR